MDLLDHNPSQEIILERSSWWGLTKSEGQQYVYQSSIFKTDVNFSSCYMKFTLFEFPLQY